MNKNILPVLMTASLISLAMLPLRAPGAEVAMLFKQDLADMAGKAGQVLTVEFAPGEVSAPHRHNAHTFVYVLEGSVVMQVKGGEEKTLTAGQVFYENPDDIHTLKRVWSAGKEVMAPGEIDAVTKEMVYIAVSVANACEYCVHSHTSAAFGKGMSETQYGELLAVIALAQQNNGLASGMQVPVDGIFLKQ